MKSNKITIIAFPTLKTYKYILFYSFQSFIQIIRIYLFGNYMSILVIGQRNKTDQLQPSLERLQLFQIKKLKIYKQKQYRQQLKKQIQTKKQREKYQRILNLQFQRNLLKQYKDNMIQKYKNLYKKPLYVTRFKTQANQQQYNKSYLQRPLKKSLPYSRLDYYKDTQKKRRLDNSLKNIYQPNNSKYISSFQVYNNPQDNYRSERLNTQNIINTKQSYLRDHSFDKNRFKELSSHYNKKIDEMYQRAKHKSVERIFDNYHYKNNQFSSLSKDEKIFSLQNKGKNNYEDQSKGVKLPAIGYQNSKYQEDTQISWRQWFSKQKQHQLQNNYKNALIDNDFRRRFNFNENQFDKF